MYVCACVVCVCVRACVCAHTSSLFCPFPTADYLELIYYFGDKYNTHCSATHRTARIAFVCDPCGGKVSSLSLSFYFSSSVSFFISLTILSLTHSSTVRRVRRLAQLNQSNGLSHAPQTFTISIPNTTEHKIFFICVCGGGGGENGPFNCLLSTPKSEILEIEIYCAGLP